MRGFVLTASPAAGQTDTQMLKKGSDRSLQSWGAQMGGTGLNTPPASLSKCQSRQEKHTAIKYVQTTHLGDFISALVLH